MSIHKETKDNECFEMKIKMEQLQKNTFNTNKSFNHNYKKQKFTYKDGSSKNKNISLSTV